MEERKEKLPLHNPINIQEAIDKNWNRVMEEEQAELDALPKQFDVNKGEYVEMIINEP